MTAVTENRNFIINQNELKFYLQLHGNRIAKIKGPK
jgi:hypothetical protein